MSTRFQTKRPASRERGRAFMYSLGLVGVVAAVAFGVVGYNAPNSIPGRSYYTIQAAFTNADNLTGHYQVRHDGKLVGQVLHPRVEHGQAVVDLQLDPSEKPLLSDTTIEVRPRSPVGVRYVDIHAGTKGHPLADNTRIPASQTKSTRQLDEVLSTFDAETRLHSQQLLRALGTGLAGRGGDVNAALNSAPGMLRGTQKVLDTIARRTSAVPSFIRGTGVATSAADPVRRQIAEGFAPEARALRPFSDASVRKTLERAPSALSVVSSGLPRVDPFLGELTGFAHNLRPALRPAPVAFSQTSALLREARPGLLAAKHTLATAGRAVTPALALLHALRPVLPNLEGTLADVTPIIAVLSEHRCDFNKFGTQWASMMGYGNSAGGVLRFNVVTPTQVSVYGQTTPIPAGVKENPYPGPCQAGHEIRGG